MHCRLSFSFWIFQVLKALESVLDETTKGDSNAEIEFTLKHKINLTNYIAYLSSCETLESLLNTFMSFANYVESLGSGTSYQISLASVSPVLENFNFSEEGNEIHLPGLPSDIYLVSVDPNITALATKTKPKRIKFLASNGKRYEYLVKGNENLNVDAGVMQFLQMAQNYLECPTRTYSVTPLGMFFL